MNEETITKLICIVGGLLLIIAWSFGCWVSWRDKKDGRESTNHFGM